MFCKAKSAQKNFFLLGNFRPLLNYNVQMLDHFFPLLFPKDSESLKILDIRLREVGAKRPLNGISKVNRHTDKHTDTQTDILTYRKHRPRGPILWKCLFHYFKVFELNKFFLVFSIWVNFYSKAFYYLCYKKVFLMKMKKKKIFRNKKAPKSHKNIFF